ncbi:hypothetical protein IC620_03950 [Hazenella sp. IB182357]|uniref:Uncharacterized protein n=1 Tax=Polycladospora coralii TaxID=2771432 RepID=A0A926NDL4_9BACL|nr:hypothetical protein [Polycladospora coralii]MBD1371508.1 hypothetical protein [Polycladospora coralii]MBS7528974.1 hypothetical protein [Polycladospora coralii]
MDSNEKLPADKRRELNRQYREGEISKKQLMEKMKNGWFDRERLSLREKFDKLDKKQT